jgi:hypothetical protein
MDQPAAPFHISERAKALFAQFKRARPGSQRWMDIYPELHRECGWMPWEWPAISPPRPGEDEAALPWYERHERQRWRRLEAALREED